VIRRALPLCAIAVLLFMLFKPLRPVAAGMDGIIMHGGKMMMMKAGRAMGQMTTTNMTMSNGALVMPDGRVRQPGGEEIQMKDGQMMMMDGTIMDGGYPKPMMKPKGMDAGE
jgi:hypothetical protein